MTISLGTAAWTVVEPEGLRDRAEQTLSSTPRPFLRWAGSKRTVLTQIIPAFPASYRTYVEPFLGGGSLFFLLEPERAILGDSCGDLITTYEAVAEDAEQVLAYLRRWKPDREFFYAMRRNRSNGRFKRAAEFIYLNKVCWNGLYRVNSQGVFNVPYGAPKSDTLIDVANLRACAALLEGGSVELTRADFGETVARAGDGDLVFMDPPYVTRHNNNGFIDYNEELFSWADQMAAARAAADAVARGAHVIVANAHHSDVVDLYPGFELLRLERASTIASASSKRGRVQEAIFWKGQ